MQLTRPALEILGISPQMARLHPPAVIVSIADAIYRAAMGRYHTDKGTEAIKLPKGVDLTELQEARDAVRANPRTCIEQITSKKKPSRSERDIEEIVSRVSTYEKMDDAWSNNTLTLWDYIAHEKLNLNPSEEMMQQRIAYSTVNLKGIAIAVSMNEGGREGFYEYLCHNGTWFKRPLIRASFSRAKPYPPCIPPELVMPNNDVTSGLGSFFDQAGPHMISEGFAVIGSYTKSDIAEARTQRRMARGQKPKKSGPMPPVSTFQLKAPLSGISSLIAAGLKPRIVTGAVLMGVVRGADNTPQYVESGVIINIRVFDAKQRA